MLQNLCTLPVDNDIFSLAVHPSRPLVTVGLASGHVQCFRLPSSYSDATSADDASILSDGMRTVTGMWRTRRHKGSCRCLAYSHDGENAFSAGTDNLLKYFSVETGVVKSKILVPRAASSRLTDSPALLQVLNPQTLLLACDSGALHILDLRDSGPGSKPAQTHFPHSDYISSVSPLLPYGGGDGGGSGGSSSFPRQWVSTGGMTLAVTDVRRGVLVRSEDQEDELLCSRFVSGVGPRSKRSNGVVAVGSATGVMTMWDRGSWDDQLERIIVGNDSLDSMVEVPERAGWGGKRVVVGLGDGTVRVVDLVRREVDPLLCLRHGDELDVVVGVDFDSENRMITAGGKIIKVWENPDATDEEEDDDDGHDSKSGTEDDSDSANDEAAKKKSVPPVQTNGQREGKKRSRPAESSEDSSDDDGDNDDSDSDEYDELEEMKNRAQRRKEAAKRLRLGPMGAHGVLGFEGLD